jgi:hypothetical protein
MAASRPATFLQERMFRLSRAHVDHDVSICAWHVLGELDPDRFAATVRALVHRHSALRSSLHADGGRVLEVVHDETRFPIAHLKVDSVPAQVARRRLAAVAAAAVRQPVPLSSAPWGSVVVAALGAAEHVLIWRFGHAGWDAFSAAVLARDFVRLYADGDAACQGGLDVHARLSERRHEHSHPDAAEYWRRALADTRVPERRAGPLGYIGVDVHTPPISAEATARLERLARAEGATLPVALLALLARALAPRSDERARLFAVFDANREREALRDGIGCVVNLLLAPMHNAADSASTLRVARDALFGAYDHKLPLEQQLRFLPGWDSPRTPRPVFTDAILNVHPAAVGSPAHADGAPPLRLLRCDPPRRVRALGPWFGSGLVLNVAPDPDHTLRTWWTFDSRTLSAGEVARIATRFTKLVHAAG